MNSKFVKEYQEVNSFFVDQNSNSHEIVSKLFEIAINKLQIAVNHIEHNNISGKGTSISEVIKIFEKLIEALDNNINKGVVMNLKSLYNGIINNLIRANFDNDCNEIRSIIKFIINIKKIWDKAGVSQNELN